jgi:hypothetical protein
VPTDAYQLILMPSTGIKLTFPHARNMKHGRYTFNKEDKEEERYGYINVLYGFGVPAHRLFPL